MSLAAAQTPWPQNSQQSPLHVGLDQDQITIGTSGLNPAQLAHLVKEVRTVVTQAEQLFGHDHDETLVTYDDRGAPYINPSKLSPGYVVPVNYYSDCSDTETTIRIDMDSLGGIPDQIKYDGDIEPIEGLSPAHLSFVIASAHGKRLDLPESQQTPIILLGNAAPRKGDSPNSVGEMFVLAELTGNVFYMGTIGGLSLVQDQIVKERIWEVDIEHKNPNTVFRSEKLPRTAFRWFNGEAESIRGEVNTSEIPELSDRRIVGSIDSFGNIKTRLRKIDLEQMGISAGDTLRVKIGEIEHTVRYGQSLADASDGDLVIARGSTKHGGDFLLDIYCIGNERDGVGTAAVELFGLSGQYTRKAGREIEIQKHLEDQDPDNQ